MGHAAAQSPQPVHLLVSTNRARWRSRTVKSPGWPLMLSTSVIVRMSMLRWRPVSTNLGDMMHIAQSLVGNVLSSWAIVPPMAGPESVR